ncbi:uncharacterized protein K444DRAFT_399867 [Hyaloscypha bicolor E]|uniref:Uncharacterized protein n=1 Tax=Hyaloscypha bicolor E TaxID=1095630 RepID=A0A2J6TBA3_9HELO|nr:uncharacterized protein K444DRAFT_399867 [Hyaloscypha bicolor E]PMD60263.1 hypothetical protein K444DRAFT_399867 [Hyaloscypha bicolor E]
MLLSYQVPPSLSRTCEYQHSRTPTPRYSTSHSFLPLIQQKNIWENSLARIPRNLDSETCDPSSTHLTTSGTFFHENPHRLSQVLSKNTLLFFSPLWYEVFRFHFSKKRYQPCPSCHSQPTLHQSLTLNTVEASPSSRAISASRFDGHLMHQFLAKSSALYW